MDKVTYKHILKVAFLLFPDVNFETQKGQLAFRPIKSSLIQNSFSLIYSPLDEKGKTGMRT